MEVLNCTDGGKSAARAVGRNRAEKEHFQDVLKSGIIGWYERFLSGIFERKYRLVIYFTLKKYIFCYKFPCKGF